MHPTASETQWRCDPSVPWQQAATAQLPKLVRPREAHGRSFFSAPANQ